MYDPRDPEKDSNPWLKGCLGVLAFFLVVAVAFVFFVIAVCAKR